MRTLIAFLLLTAPALADKSLVLSADEERVLMQLIDMANKAGGLSNAEMAIYFAKKIQSAPQVEKPKEKE